MVTPTSYEVTQNLTQNQAEQIKNLSTQIENHDGTTPFGEAVFKTLKPTQIPVTHTIATQNDKIIAYSNTQNRRQPFPPVTELAVHPQHRNQGVAGNLVELISKQHPTTTYWAHQTLENAKNLAHKLHATPIRTLLIMELDSNRHVDMYHEHPGILITTATPADAEQIVDINNKAFAKHPEQGGWMPDTFQHLINQPGLGYENTYLAKDEKTGSVVGFHITKIHNHEHEDKFGEVYVVGVDPKNHGNGVGSIVTSFGVNELFRKGCKKVILYVDLEHQGAVKLYTKLGFTEISRDTEYQFLN